MRSEPPNGRLLLPEIPARLYPLADLRRETGLAPTTIWRRIERLAARGLVRREVQIGGKGGTASHVLFRGSLRELAHLVLEREPPRIAVRTRQACPTCGRDLPEDGRGPPCPVCGFATQIRGRAGGLVSVWCAPCRTGYSTSTANLRPLEVPV